MLAIRCIVVVNAISRYICRHRRDAVKLFQSKSYLEIPLNSKKATLEKFRFLLIKMPQSFPFRIQHDFRVSIRNEENNKKKAAALSMRQSCNECR